MSTETSSIQQLKYFLKEMFQFNANDLDFGIYKIYNLKRKEIESFIDGDEANCLEPTINQTLEKVSNIEKQVELTSLSNYLTKLNKGALLEDTTKNFELIQKFIDTEENEAEKEKLASALTASTKQFSITDEIKDKIYSHILGYFEMYYSNGDFGYNNRSRSLYKVPYEADYDGNDTMFHWKHKGSLYIKSGNSFNAIKFKLKHLGKEFELRLETNEDSTDEQVAQNNNKDIQLKHYKFNRFEDVDGVTRIVFNLSNSSTTKEELFKLLFTDVFKSEENLDNYLFADAKFVFNDLTDDYDKVLDGSVKGIGALRVKRSTLLNKVNKNFERGKKIKVIIQDGQERFSDDTLETIYNLDQKLNSFYIGNDSDYFIHEDLYGFLTQEKERYIKNYILSDLSSILNGKLDNTTIIIAKAFNDVADRIIEFLSAIEEFQKKLFTMKKKVVESEYCLTIDNIDEKYYTEILTNQTQQAEWENLFSIRLQNIDEMKAEPTLVLDTKFFKQEDGSNPFKDKVLAEIDNLDEKTNGLLINSENFQALTILQERYRNKINCIYIDPPYNTKSSPIIYKNHFKHSSWTTLIDNRMKISKSLLEKSKGTNIVAIDDAEMLNLYSIINTNFKGYRNTKLTIIHNPKGNITTDFNRVHEYCFYSIPESSKGVIKRTTEENVTPRRMRRWGAKSLRTERRPSFYPIYIKNDKIVNIGVVPPDSFHPQGKNVKLNDGEIAIYPIDQDGIERRWNFGLDTIKDNLDRISIQEVDGVFDLYVTHEITVPKTVWSGGEFDAGKHGNTLLVNILGEKLFDFPKSINQVIKCIDIASELQSTVLDYFAGSGTTGHAIIRMNQDNVESKRNYILVEMGKYFNSITKRRIQRVIYSKNWVNGKPTDNVGSRKHIFKYIILEQYEDVLDAIEQFDGETPKNLPLKYLYKPELNQLNSSLDLSKPFSNKIKYGQPTKEGFIDLVDTYNYLQGYEIKSIKPYTIADKYYKVVETVDRLVIWRDIALGEDDCQAVKEIAKKYPEVTLIDINFDFNILATFKDKQLPVDDRLIGLTVIHTQFFSE
ncbi:MAG: DNA methyltransferase [Methylococcaceae bacterium]